MNQAAHAGTRFGRATVSLKEAETAGGRAAAAQLAARRACEELLQPELSAGTIRPADLAVSQATSNQITVDLAPAAADVLARKLIAGIEVSLVWSVDTVEAAAQAVLHPRRVPWFGHWVYHLLPFRRSLALANLRRVFGDHADEAQLRRLARAYYAHLFRSLLEMARLPLMSAAQKLKWVRIENEQAAINVHRPDRGLLVLTGHFGNWEAATVAALRQFPQYAGKFHFVRRALKPQWFDHFITRRFRRAGFGTLSKRGSMERILELLGEGAIIVFTFDQHAGRKDGVAVDFLGHPAGTFKSLAILALNTGAPVVPVSTWREPDGRHTLRFEDPLPLIQHDNVTEAIRLNTRAYNAALERMLLRHPEQWIWMHRRWKLPPRPPS